MWRTDTVFQNLIFKWAFIWNPNMSVLKPMQPLYHFHRLCRLTSSQQTPASASVCLGRGCGTNSLLQRETHIMIQHQSNSSVSRHIWFPSLSSFLIHFISFDRVFLPLTCRTLSRNRSPIKGRTVLSDGPNLGGASDGDGLERLISSHVEPRGTLWAQQEDVRTINPTLDWYCFSCGGRALTSTVYLSTGTRHKRVPSFIKVWYVFKIRKGSHTLSKPSTMGSFGLICSECSWVSHQVLKTRSCVHSYYSCDSQQVSERWLPVGRGRPPCCWWPTQEPRPRCSGQHRAGWWHHSVGWVGFLARVL